MKLKNNYTLTGLAGEYVAVPLDHPDVFHGIVKLNESGAEVFRSMSEGLTYEETVQRLMNRYPGLDAETANKAVSIVNEKLREAGLLEE